MTKLIGLKTVTTSRLLPAFRTNDTMTAFWIYYNPKKKLLEVKIQPSSRIFDDVFGTPDNPKEVMKKRKRNFKIAKSLEDDKPKPIDKSNWVKPDEQSIKNKLFEELFFLSVLDVGQYDTCSKKNETIAWKKKNENIDYWETLGKVKILHSVLHSKSKTNPQSLWDNIAVDIPILTLLSELDNKKHLRWFRKFIMSHSKKSKYGRMTRDERIKFFRDWQIDRLKDMVVSHTMGKPLPKMPRYKKVLWKLYKIGIIPPNVWLWYIKKDIDRMNKIRKGE